MLKDKGNIQVLKVDRRFITLFKLFFRGEEIKSSEMRIFFEILVRIGRFQPQSNNCIALSSSELVCGLPPPTPPPPRMDHPTRSVRLLQTGIERLTIVSGTNVYLHMQQTQLIN